VGHVPDVSSASHQGVRGRGVRGLLAGIGTRDLGYGLGAFVIVFLGFGGYEFITERRCGS
jgi:hypothetical protein